MEVVSSISDSTPPPIPMTNQMKPLKVATARKVSINSVHEQVSQALIVNTSDISASQGTLKKDVLEGLNMSNLNSK